MSDLEPTTPPPFTSPGGDSGTVGHFGTTGHLGAGGSQTQAQLRWAAQVHNAYKIYGSGENEVRALNGVTAGFESGKFTAIMGPSGSGKSTLMQCAAGLDKLSSGDCYIGDTNISQMSEKALTLLRRERVGFIFQQFNLLPVLTAEENILFPLTLSGRSPDAEWMRHVVNTVGLADRLSHKPSELSGGQQQRVAVARALVERPEIIFADEPTGNLDSTSSGEILAFMESAVTQFGQTVVMVTHDPVAAAHASRVLFLADGLIVDELMAPTRDSILDRMRDLGN